MSEPCQAQNACTGAYGLKQTLPLFSQNWLNTMLYYLNPQPKSKLWEATDHRQFKSSVASSQLSEGWHAPGGQSVNCRRHTVEQGPSSHFIQREAQGGRDD